MTTYQQTIRTFLDATVNAIDDRFGDGYAKKNPALVGACIQAMADAVDPVETEPRQVQK